MAQREFVDGSLDGSYARKIGRYFWHPDPFSGHWLRFP